jgi:transmembrane sensor
MQGSDIREEALGWVVRTNDPDFSAWDEFTEWLERSPEHASAYHRLLASEDEVKPLLPAAAPIAQGPRWRLGARSAGWFSAAAAAAVAVLAVPRVMPVEHSTLPGQTATIALGGRDKILLNGGTRVELGGWNRRNVRLVEGQILLSLEEPGGRQVAVESGDLRLVDVGTVFEVTRSGQTTRVSVSKGAVMADPHGAALRLDPGEGLETSDGATRLAAIPADAAAVGSFAQGQLLYRGERVDRIVEDLRRSSGIDFSSDPAIDGQRFTGTLSVKEVKRDPRSLEPLLGFEIERSGQGWRLREGG